MPTNTSSSPSPFTESDEKMISKTSSLEDESLDDFHSQNLDLAAQTNTDSDTKLEDLQSQLSTPEAIKHENRLRKIVTSHPKRVKVILKVLSYALEIWLITTIVAQIPILWLGIVVGIILGIGFTKLADYLLKKVELRFFPPETSDQIHEVHHETRMDVVDTMIQNWAILPELVKDQFISSVFRTESARLFFAIRKQKHFKTLILGLLEARQAVRDNKIEEAKKLLNKILDKSSEKDHAFLREEATYLLKELS